MKKAFALILAAVLFCTASCGNGGGSAVTDGTFPMKVIRPRLSSTPTAGKIRFIT